MSAWRERAACRDAPAGDARLAFGSGQQQQRFARIYCGHCPVKEACFAVGRDEWGVWGGTTEKKRGNLLGSRRERTAGHKTGGKACGSAYAYQKHRENGEEPCAACLRAWTEYCQERKRIRLGRTA